MKEYLDTVEDVLKKLKSSENGLDEKEAESRLEKDGKNKLEEPPKEPLIKKFFKSLLDPMIIMLLVSAGISLVTSIISHESFADVIIILFVVITNTILGMVQESKAENAIESLKEMTKATSKVQRNGMIRTINSEDLVKGDVIVLEAGDSIPADCRIIEAHSLKVEESALTGESVPINKMVDILNIKNESINVPLGDRTNMLYSGSNVVYGRGRAIVVASGMETEMGKIADALQNAVEEKTPLQKKMAEISKVLTKLVVAISVVVFIAGLIRAGSLTGETILNTFMVAIALAVAAIPEGLPAIVTIILSIGVTSMAKKNALIRRISAVETLGCTQIICTDKTGTLTQNRMTVTKYKTNNSQLLAKAMALCNDATLKKGEKESVGEPTEAALVNFAYNKDLPKYKLLGSNPRIGEAPFDSIRKMMSTVHRTPEGIVQYTKGAIEMVIDRCDNYIADDGKVKKLTDVVKKEYLKESNRYADDALRVLSAAYKEYKEEPKDYSPEEIEKGMTFIGFVGMIDPCRPEVFAAIDNCRSAGIRPIMITGDHIDTAAAIGKNLGIIQEKKEAITGAEIEKIEGQELIECINSHSVFARVQPEHKTKIVNCLRSQDYVVAMTGDGVNDAPSIKSADIGVSMGITGTDVTKSASDMVLADDNFATIVNAVEEGRKIYDNIRKVLQFQLSTNIAEVIYIFVASILGITISTPAQLLWVNLVTDSTPGLALGMEKAEGDVMQKAPRKSSESVFAHGAAPAIIVHGFMMAILVIVAFFIGHYLETGVLEITESKDGMTMAFLVVNFIQMFYAIDMRSQRESIFTMKTTNFWLLGSLLVTILLTLAVIYVPFLSNMFGFSEISLEKFGLSIVIAFLVIPLTEIYKIIERKISK